MVKTAPWNARFDPAGYCIYCGVTDVALTDEHIIPFSLGGQMILPESSCGNCANIIKKFEQECARKMFGSLRIRQGLPTRRKKERPTHLPLYRTGEDGELTPALDVPVDDYPSHLMLMKFSTPGIIKGLPDDGHHTVTGEAWYSTHKHDVEEKYGPGLRYKMSFNPLIFSQLLAKIAHSFAVASLQGERGNFTPLLPDFILGKHSRQGYLIGGSTDALEPDETRNLHQLEGRAVCDGKYLAISIHLFAPLGAPVYYAIAGKIHDELTRD